LAKKEPPPFQTRPPTNRKKGLDVDRASFVEYVAKMAERKKKEYGDDAQDQEGLHQRYARVREEKDARRRYGK
jgi:hypothetical protein